MSEETSDIPHFQINQIKWILMDEKVMLASLRDEHHLVTIDVPRPLMTEFLIRYQADLLKETKDILK